MLARFGRIIRNPPSAFNKLITRTLWQICVPLSLNSRDSIHVDLGSGSSPRNPFRASTLIGADFHDNFRQNKNAEFVKCDLTKDLPFGDDSVDSFSAFDVLEHIPRWERVEGEIHFPFINLMNEVSRCLKPGGLFLAVTPAFPSPVAFQDPTHVNIITNITIQYFSGTSPSAKMLGYGFSGEFQTVCQVWVNGPEKFDLDSSYENLANAGSFEKILVIIKPRNLRHLCVIIFRNAFKRQSHLLWVLKKSV